VGHGLFLSLYIHGSNLGVNFRQDWPFERGVSRAQVMFAAKGAERDGWGEKSAGAKAPFLFGFVVPRAKAQGF
jgi:hypothetical protein